MFESSQQVIVGIYQYEIYDHMCDVCSHGTYAKSVYSVITFIVSLYQYLNWKRNDVALSPSEWGSILRIFWAPARFQSTKVHVSGFNSANHGRNWIPSLFTTNRHFQTPDECIFFTQSTQEIHKSSSQGGFPFNNLFLRSFMKMSQHHLLCAVKINPTCDNWGKDLTKDGEGSTWDTLCRARYTDLA